MSVFVCKYNMENENAWSSIYLENVFIWKKKTLEKIHRIMNIVYKDWFLAWNKKHR